MKTSKLEIFADIERYGHLLLGKLAIERGFISYQKLVKSLKIQHNRPGDKLGSILIELDYIDKYDLQTLLRWQRKFKEQKVASWPYLPDTVVKGLLYTGEQRLGKVEQKHILQAGYLSQDTGSPEPMAISQYFLKENLVSQEELTHLQNNIQTNRAECPQCSRYYLLFNCPSLKKIICPVCRDCVVEFSPGKRKSPVHAHKTMTKMPAISETKEHDTMIKIPQMGQLGEQTKKKPAKQEQSFREKTMARMPRIAKETTQRFQELYSELEDFQPKEQKTKKKRNKNVALGGEYIEVVLSRKHAFKLVMGVASAIILLFGAILWFVFSRPVPKIEQTKSKDLGKAITQPRQQAPSPTLQETYQIYGEYIAPQLIKIEGKASQDEVLIIIQGVDKKILGKHYLPVESGKYRAKIKGPRDQEFVWLILPLEKEKKQLQCQVLYPEKFRAQNNLSKAKTAIENQIIKLENIIEQFIASRNSEQLQEGFDYWEKRFVVKLYQRQLANKELGTENFGNNVEHLYAMLENLVNMEEKLKIVLLFQPELNYGVKNFADLAVAAKINKNMKEILKHGKKVWGKEYNPFRKFQSQ